MRIQAGDTASFIARSISALGNTLSTYWRYIQVGTYTVMVNSFVLTKKLRTKCSKWLRRFKLQLIEKFQEEWEQEIDFDGTARKIQGCCKPEVETSLDKEGHPDRDKNAREITGRLILQMVVKKIFPMDF